MRAYVEIKPWADSVDIYVVTGETMSGDRYALRIRDPLDISGNVYESVAFGADPGPTLRLPLNVARAIAAAVTEASGPSLTDRDAVMDARATRDRLLALVEKSWEERP